MLLLIVIVSIFLILLLAYGLKLLGLKSGEKQSKLKTQLLKEFSQIKVSNIIFLLVLIAMGIIALSISLEAFVNLKSTNYNLSFILSETRDEIESINGYLADETKNNRKIFLKTTQKLKTSYEKIEKLANEVLTNTTIAYLLQMLSITLIIMGIFVTYYINKQREKIDEVSQKASEQLKETEKQRKEMDKSINEANKLLLESKSELEQITSIVDSINKDLTKTEEILGESKVRLTEPSTLSFNIRKILAITNSLIIAHGQTANLRSANFGAFEISLEAIRRRVIGGEKEMIAIGKDTLDDMKQLLSIIGDEVSVKNEKILNKRHKDKLARIIKEIQAILEGSVFVNRYKEKFGDE